MLYEILHLFKLSSQKNLSFLRENNSNNKSQFVKDHRLNYFFFSNWSLFSFTFHLMDSTDLKYKQGGFFKNIFECFLLIVIVSCSLKLMYFPLF